MTDTPSIRDLIAQYIRTVPNFPAPGIMFRDITPLLGNPQAFGQALDWLTERAEGAEAVVGIESRGFILGAPVAQRLKLPFVPIRKGGKLPHRTISLSYDLEYGSAEIEIHADGLQPGSQAALIDDLLATGGTAEAAVQLIARTGAEIASIAFLIELTELSGRDAISPYPVESLLRY